MKKQTRFLAVLSLLIASFVCQEASAQQIRKGDWLLSPGLGFGYWYAGGVTLNFNAEYSVTDELGIGGYFGYTRWDHDYAPGFNDYHYTFIDVGARASYHFAKVFKVRNKKFDPYAGGILGFLSSSYNYDGPNNPGYHNTYDSKLRIGIHAGARYYFTDSFAAYGELTSTLSPLILGVTWKL